MCYPAEVERDWLKYRRITDADISIHEFYRTFVKRQRGLPFRMPWMLDRWFDGIPGDEADGIRKLITEWNAEQVTTWEQQLFASRKRIADGDCALLAKVTKRAQDERLPASIG